MSWSPILGVVLILYAVFVIYRGRLTSGDDYGHTSTFSRAEKPVQFWLSVIVMLAFAVILLFNLFNF